MNNKRYQVKAGRFQVDKTTNKVKPDKSKGLIIVERNQQDETHFKWVNTDQKIQEIDMIVFANDAKFQSMPNKNNTFVLKFQTDADKYFFWMQEKIQSSEIVKKINDIINYQEPQQIEPIQQQKPQKSQKFDKMQPQKVQKPMNTTQKPIFGQDFISRLTKNITAAQKNQQTNITHLQKIFNYQTVNKILGWLSQEDKKQLVEYLPQQQQTVQAFNTNVRSAQFSQAIDALSDALNSQTAIAIFAQMGLNQNHLQKHYGVHAFIKALIEWGKQQKK